MALNPYTGSLSYGLRGDVGGENATWGNVNGKEVPVIKGKNGNYLLSDLMSEYGSMDNIRAQGRANPGTPEYYNRLSGSGDGSGTNGDIFGGDYEYGLDLWGARPSNDTFSGKDGLADLATIGGMAGAAVGGGALLGSAGGGAGALGGGSTGWLDFLGDAGNFGGAGADIGMNTMMGSDAMTGGAMDMGGSGGAFNGAGSAGAGGAAGGMAGGEGGAMDMFGSANGPGTSQTVFGGSGVNPMGTQWGAGAGGLQTPFGNIPMSDIVKGGLNFGVNQYLAGQNRQAGQQAADRSDALLQQQRAPFQQAAQGMVQNPQDYMQNNPFAQALTNQYKNNVIPANVAKSGNTGFEADRLGAQYATALGGNYNQLLGTLMGYGGFNQGTGFSGSNQLQGDMAANQNTAEAFRGVGKMADSLFGTPEQPKTPQQNPVTGSYTVIS